MLSRGTRVDFGEWAVLFVDAAGYEDQWAEELPGYACVALHNDGRQSMALFVNAPSWGDPVLPAALRRHLFDTEPSATTPTDVELWMRASHLVSQSLSTDDDALKAWVAWEAECRARGEVPFHELYPLKRWVVSQGASVWIPSAWYDIVADACAFTHTQSSTPTPRSSVARHTLFHHHTYDSLLEARVAAVLSMLNVPFKPHALKIQWDGFCSPHPSPFRAASYTPDFWLPTLSMVVDVKPSQAATAEERRRMEVIADAGGYLRAALLHVESQRSRYASVNHVSDMFFLILEEAHQPPRVLGVDRETHALSLHDYVAEELLEVDPGDPSSPFYMVHHAWRLARNSIA